MLRVAIIIGLLASFFFLARGAILNWQNNPIPPAPSEVESIEAAPLAIRTIDFFHPVPQPLPDLHKGYVFNADRILEIEESAAEPEPEPNNGKSEDEIDIDFDSVMYVGSVITGKLRKAIVSYTVEPTRRRISRTPTRGRTAQQPGRTTSAVKYAQLTVGDSFNNYKVTGIYPDKIVFQRDDEKIEKLLYDSAKKRTPPALAGQVLKERKTRPGTGSESPNQITIGGDREQEEPSSSIADKKPETAAGDAVQRQTLPQRQPTMSTRRATIMRRSTPGPALQQQQPHATSPDLGP